MTNFIAGQCQGASVLLASTVVVLASSRVHCGAAVLTGLVEGGEDVEALFGHGDPVDHVHEKSKHSAAQRSSSCQRRAERRIATLLRALPWLGQLGGCPGGEGLSTECRASSARPGGG